MILLAVVTLGGAAMTYIVSEDEPLMWRIAAGCVAGSAVCGTVAFILGLAFGLTPVTAAVSIAAALLCLMIFKRAEVKRRSKRDWDRAKGKLQGANLRKALKLCGYLALALLLIAFFDRAFIETPAGIFTGGSQNLGDLPFHLGAIFSFTEADNFPPQNPSFAGARFSYPLVADLLTAVFIKLGADVGSAMLIQNVSWAFSLFVILRRYVLRLTGDGLAAAISPLLLFFSGGLGFAILFSEYFGGPGSLGELLWHLPGDYTIGSDLLRWGNALTVLFITQRSLLLGMPLVLVVLGVLWRVFAINQADAAERAADVRAVVAVGLLAGLLPLVHLHSLFVLFIVGVFMIILRPGRLKEWLIFAGAAALVAVPELAWAMSGSSSEAGKFIGWHFGWNKGETNWFWFWFVNTGVFIPMLAAGLWLVFRRRREVDSDDLSPHRSTSLLLFYLPFAAMFVIANVVRLAPWEWDNIKVLIYWFVGSIPFAALVIAELWRRQWPLKAAAALCFLILTASGMIDVWRTISGQVNTLVFDRNAVEIAEQIREHSSPSALFLNAPTYNSAVVLSGRQSLMRYTGHLFSHGIDYAAREDVVRRIYQGGPAADRLLAANGIDYVLISPEERSALKANESYFAKFPVAAESGPYRVYKIR